MWRERNGDKETWFKLQPSQKMKPQFVLYGVTKSSHRFKSHLFEHEIAWLSERGPVWKLPCYKISCHLFFSLDWLVTNTKHQMSTEGFCCCYWRGKPCLFFSWFESRTQNLVLHLVFSIWVLFTRLSNENYWRSTDENF